MFKLRSKPPRSFAHFRKWPLLAIAASLLVLAAVASWFLIFKKQSSSCTGEFDFAILGGEIIDGLGRAPFRADLGIRDKRIACIGTVDPKQAAQVLDATGLTVSPG